MPAILAQGGGRVRGEAGIRLAPGSGRGGEAVVGAAHRLQVSGRLAQPGGVALGAQAGPAAVRQLADDARFSRFRQVTQTPVHVVLELRP